MILVDTSVWIDHLRSADAGLVQLLTNGRVLGHPFVTGEVACGALQNRSAILSLMQDLPPAPVAADEEVLDFIARRNLGGRGIGYVDAHLLCAVVLSGSDQLWSRDKSLARIAEEFQLSFAPTGGQA